MKTDSELATLFSALAHPSRIAILRCLLPYGASGQQFGELSSALGISPSTLTHHLREMENSGVLCREVCGRITKLRLNIEVLDDVVKQLTALCCCGLNILPLQDKQD